MNRTSASVLTLAIILSIVTPSFRSGSSPGTAVRTNNQREAKKRPDQHSGKGKTKSGQCDPDNDYEGQLIDAIRLSYPASGTETGSTEPCLKSFTVPETIGAQNIESDVILAFVPDPRHTNLSLLFDRQMEALQQGIQNAGWTFQRALMPWENSEPPEFADFISRDLEKTSEEETEKEPGLLIFTRANLKNSSLTDKLLVFVIGESPTGGVRKPQFWSATQLVRNLFKKPPEVLRIFGPTFSGSLQSVSELLKCNNLEKPFPCNSKQIIEFSGTVTSRSAIERFKDGFKEANPRLSFATFQEYDDYEISRFLNFAEKRGYQACEIAVLSEDESAYGTKGFSDDDSPMHNDCKKNGADNDIVSLYFPREISQLRNAYQQNASQASQADKTPQITLPLDLASPENNDDTVQEYSHKQTPLSQEAVLLGIASELRHHEIKLIVLRATNSLDQLFLARYLRGAYPQGRIVILGSDLLFRREIQDSRLLGIMALSTYSLTPASDHEFQDHRAGGHSHVDHVFPSSDAVGTYNATTLLAATLDKAVPADCDLTNRPDCLPAKHLFQYGTPQWPTNGEDHILDQPDRPPVHLTVLGHDGFADVAVLPPDGTPSTAQSSLPLVQDENRHHEPEEETWPAWRFLTVLALVTALAFSYFIVSASILSGSEAVAHLAPPQADSRGWLFGVNAYLHFALLLTVLWPYLYVLYSSEVQLQKWLLMAAMALVATVGAWDLWRRKFAFLAGSLMIACALTALWIIKFRPNVSDEPGYMYMFGLRALQLASGVSPLVPILLLVIAGLWGAWYSLSSSSLVDGRRPALPRRSHLSEVDAGGTGELNRSYAILENDNRRLLQLLRPDFVEGRAVVAGIFTIAAAWWCAAYGFRPLRTLERPGYEYVLAGMVIFIAILLISGILRLQSIWSELRRLLVALDSLPLRRGFKRLEGFSWSPMWRVGAGSLTELRRILCRQLESWQCLLNLDVPGIKGLSKEFLTQAGQVKHAYTAAKENYSRDDTAPDVSAPAKPLQAISAGTGGAAAQPALEKETSPAATGPSTIFVRFILRRLTAPWDWVKKVFRQGSLDKELIDQFCAFQQEFAKTGACALAYSEAQWEKATSIASNGETEEGSGKIAEALEALRRTREEKKQSLDEETNSNRLHACEEFVALLYTAFVLVVLVRIRGLIVAAGGMYVFLLAALSVYPFQPQVVIRTALMVVLVVIVAIVGFVYAQMHRDSTLSYITDTKPGELGVSFWIRILSFIAVPAFGLLASQYPEIGSIFSSWVEPAVNALK